jgi:hydroxypyruvate isomerase
MQIMEGDVIRTIRDNHQYLFHYHTAGSPGRNELDENQELFYPAVLRASKATGSTGWVGQGFTPGRTRSPKRHASATCSRRPTRRAPITSDRFQENFRG